MPKGAFVGVRDLQKQICFIIRIVMIVYMLLYPYQDSADSAHLASRLPLAQHVSMSLPLA